MALPLGFTPLEVRTYLILTVCWISIVVVNMLEQPYARSLVVCDVPVNTTEGADFSGSTFCGNRLHVIDVGTEISGKGQSLENVGRILITLFVSGFADYGRKRAALLGQFLITLSTVLFAMAQFLPAGLAIPTYIIAQGLQGMSGIGILDQIVTGDVALQLGDSIGVYSRKGIVSALLMVLLVPIIVYVQYAEITDFTWVWTGIVVLNTIALFLIHFFFTETMTVTPKKVEESQSHELSFKGITKIAADELKTFHSIIKTHSYVGYRLGEETLNKLSDAGVIGMPFMMAQFHFSQFDAFIFNFVPMLVGGVLLGGVVANLCRKHGSRTVWKNVYAYHRSTTVMNCLLMPVRIFGFPYPLLGNLLHLPLAGFPALQQAVEIRLIGQETNAKYQAMSQLIAFFCGAITSWMYTKIFFAEASTYLRVVAPYMVSGCFLLATVPLFLLKLSPQLLSECDKLDQEAIEKAKAEAEAKEKPEGEAKTKAEETAKGEERSTEEPSSPEKTDTELPASPETIEEKPQEQKKEDDAYPLFCKLHYPLLLPFFSTVKHRPDARRELFFAHVIFHFPPLKSGGGSQRSQLHGIRTVLVAQTISAWMCSGCWNGHRAFMRNSAAETQ
eukprot:CAMPEP_0181399434 /NCGR_PEP_ID=MMETSP1110-20121109/1592_1 /TAXON_ID=174948 /ORGANISM="Symbiodinium sp., Strain CCMP421" /LENGTH=614 /DNA_ID=CAMNT_0023521491 /DNA_START=35 /DNA_END=1877 /DNA_ORIENTATION=+